MGKATINQQLNIRNNGNPFIGQSDLAVEYWDRDILGIGSPFTYSGASGETWSNAWGTNNCKHDCDSLFPLASEDELLKACKKTCENECNYKSKCPDAYVPTRESVCLRAGLTSDCKQGASAYIPSTSTSGVASPLPPTISPTTVNTATSGSGKGLSMGAKVGIGIGILAILGTGAYLIFKNRGDKS